MKKNQIFQIVNKSIVVILVVLFIIIVIVFFSGIVSGYENTIGK